MTTETVDRHLRKAFVSLLLLLFFLIFDRNAHSRESRELVVVIDVSTSMQDLLDQAKAETKQFVSSARLGDRITIITFGKSSRLLERSRMRAPYDIARVLSVIDKLEATEFVTNLPSGMERGLRELRQFYKENPESQRVLMWLSDDKDNPPKDVPDLITFASLKQQEIDRLPNQSWFEFEAPIEPEAESDLDWFVDWASRINMQLAVELGTNNLGTLLVPDLEKELRVRFEPSNRAARGTTFSVVAEVTSQGSEPYSVVVPVVPSRIVCRETPWEESFRVVFPEREGSYVCRLSFVLPSDKLLAISPPQLSLKAKVQPKIRVIEKETADIDAVISAAYERSLRRRVPTETGLAPRARSELAKEARQSHPQAALLFSQIEAHGEHEASTLLFPTSNIPLDSVYMKPSFKLPAGLELRPEFRIADGTVVADLLLTAGGKLELSDGWEMKGTVSFLSREKGVHIYPQDIPVKFSARKTVGRWGKRELATAAAYEQLSRILQIARSYSLKTLRVVLAVLAIWLLFYMIRRYGFGATELVGTLEIMRNPTERKMNSFNLRRMGRLRVTSSLTLGSSRKADITLPHASVADLHAKITTATTDAGAVVFIQPLEHNQILVNNVAYSRRKELGDNDIFSIGDFVFLYQCPESQRETIVRFADGNPIRGTLVSWDIDAPGFEFLPKGAPSPDARMIIEFSELKAVSFIRKAKRFSSELFSGSEKQSTGRPVEIVFKDTELLEGYMVGEASEWSKRFYVIPKERGEVALVLVERSAVQNVFARDAFEKPPLELHDAVRGLIHRIGL